MPPELFPLQTWDLMSLRTRELLGSLEKNNNTNAEFQTRQAFYHTINWLARHLTNCDTGLCNFCSILSLGNKYLSISWPITQAPGSAVVGRAASALFATDNVRVWRIETEVLQLLWVIHYIYSNYNLCTHLRLHHCFCCWLGHRWACLKAVGLDTDRLA